jgi:hypothetical protein
MQPQCVFWDQDAESRLQTILNREAGRTYSLPREHRCRRRARRENFIGLPELRRQARPYWIVVLVRS